MNEGYSYTYPYPGCVQITCDDCGEGWLGRENDIKAVYMNWCGHDCKGLIIDDQTYVNF